MNWRICDPKHLLDAVRLSLHEGGRFLASRVEPNGPICREPLLSYIHKASWGMYAAGVDHALIARLLDWAQREALQPNGDFYLPGEPPEYKDFQRVYRPLTFGKVAAWIGHPVIRSPRVLDRILQYQHSSGGVFAWIGDDPDDPQEEPTLGVLNTTFFGHLMIALDLRTEAVSAGQWIRRWVEANREPMAQGRLYTQITPSGDLVTHVAPGQRLAKIVDRCGPKQEFWHAGTAMAYLAALYDALRRIWGCPADEAKPYLDAALALLDFEATMPLDTYLWPSKCKVGWGAGELLRVLVEHRVGDAETIERAYRVAERVALFTFLDNQLPHGGWPAMHYPLSELAPEMAFCYKPLKNHVAVPPDPIPNSKTIWLPGEEITGEFLGEMKAIEQGVAAMLHARG
jgi:hypothetical protein